MSSLNSLDDVKRALITLEEKFKNHADVYKDHTIAFNKLKEIVQANTSDINFIKESLKEINDDTKWLRRTITGGLITLAIGSFGTVIVWIAGGFGGG